MKVSESELCMLYPWCQGKNLHTEWWGWVGTKRAKIQIFSTFVNFFLLRYLALKVIFMRQKQSKYLNFSLFLCFLPPATKKPSIFWILKCLNFLCEKILNSKIFLEKICTKSMLGWVKKWLTRKKIPEKICKKGWVVQKGWKKFTKPDFR